MKRYKSQKEILREAGERHRLYLLAKNDYEQFKNQVGADQARQLKAELSKTNKHDTHICVDAYKNGLDLSWLQRDIAADSDRYINGSAGKSALRRMKLQLGWAFISHLLLLAVAICLGVAPWINGVSLSVGNESVLFTCLFTFSALTLLLAWIVADIIKMRKFLRPEKTFIQKIFTLTLYVLFGCLVLHAISLEFDASVATMYRALSTSFIAFAHILLILDCMADLSPREYYIYPRICLKWVAGWFKGQFKPYFVFTQGVFPGYDFEWKSEEFEGKYRRSELLALEKEMKRHRWLYLSTKDGLLEFRPSPSLPFIIAYVMVDVIHTACLIAWMFSLFHTLSGASTGSHLLVAAIFCVVIFTMLDQPYFLHVRFHYHICRNFQAYKVSHLFRKLLYSVILAGACIILGLL